MSSNKRKKIEEYHDPDYCQVETKKLKSSETATDRCEKIKAIIKREFLKEINENEQQISLIDHKLTEVKRLLQRVRYAVVTNYYTKKNLEYSANELKCENSTGDEIVSNLGQQTAIHPSLKKLLGKKPVDYDEILKSRSPRNAAKNARSTLIKSRKDEKKKTRNDFVTNEMKIPRYISPIKTDVPIERINSARGRNQTSHLIVVGNTSKYIGDEKSVNEVTHKWLVYIKTKTAVGIEAMVSKVRFFLHPSYKPNDVIEVDSPPFQISRRGWGEFPIRVQLYFYDSIHQKPLQIYHNLILDKKMTGLQTMGAETVVEIWLDIPIPKSKTIEIETNTRESNCKSVSNSPKRTSTKVSMLPLSRRNSCNEIDNEEPVKVPITIKKEECLIINDTPEIQSQEMISENDEHLSEMAIPNRASHTKTVNLLNKPQTIAQGCLNEISDIFKDAATLPKIVPPPVILATEKPKTTIVQQKKTLVRCLDSNGKTIFVELQVDPKNPKNIKVIKNSSLIMSTQSGTLNQSKSQNLNSPFKQIPALPVPLSNIPSTISNVSIRPMQCIQADAMNTTITNPNPINVQSSSGLFRLEANQIHNPLEKKKFYIIQSSNLPNVHSTNPPPLVRISDPVKTTFAPNITTVKTIQSTTKSTENHKLTINANNVILKNGQIIILDREKSQLKPKQESLLKPQISLLKPIFNKSVCESITSKVPKVNLTQMPLNPSIFARKLNRKQPNPIITKRDYLKEFSLAFLRHRFQTVRSAVEYILRTVPLINTLCSISDFSAAFPFVVESHQKFNDSLLPKRRSNEWYRAKWLIRMLGQHPDLKHKSCWLPKEIIIFSRRFGYTPDVINKNLCDKKLSNNNQNSLMNLIKQHIKDEQLKNVTITFNNRINDFIQRCDESTSTYSLTTTSSAEFIDVDGDVMPPTRLKLKTEPLQGIDQKLMLDVSKIMQSGSMLVSDICREIQIKLEPEEIVEDVLCSSSHLMLWQAMRSFLEDLLRRSFASKPVAQQTSALSTERSVHVDDLKKAISTTDHFGFLTNKYLGKESS